MLPTSFTLMWFIDVDMAYIPNTSMDIAIPLSSFSITKYHYESIGFTVLRIDSISNYIDFPLRCSCLDCSNGNKSLESYNALSLISFPS